jgi:hypothetical protein
MAAGKFEFETMDIPKVDTTRSTSIGLKFYIIHKNHEKFRL